MLTSGRAVRYAAAAALFLAVGVRTEEFGCYEGEKEARKCDNQTADDRYCAELFFTNLTYTSYYTGCEQSKRKQALAAGDNYHIDYWYGDKEAEADNYRSPCARKKGEEKPNWCQQTLAREVNDTGEGEWLLVFICCCHKTNCDQDPLDSERQYRKKNIFRYVDLGMALFWATMTALFYGWLLINCCQCFWGQKEGGRFADPDLRKVERKSWHGLEDANITKEERDMAVKSVIIEELKVGVREAEIAEEAYKKQTNIDTKVKKLMGRLLAIEAAQPAKDEQQIEQENREKYKRKLEERKQMEVEEKRQKTEELKRKYLEAKRLLREGVSSGDISQKLSLSADTVSQLSITIQPGAMGRPRQPNAAEGWEAARAAGEAEMTQDSGEHTGGQTASQQSQTANSSRSPPPMPNVDTAVDESASATDNPAEPSSSVASATHYYAVEETEPAPTH